MKSPDARPFKEQLIALRKRIRRDLNRIERALERIEDDQYGRCQNCSRSIKASRLSALPFAELCAKCDEQLRHAVEMN